MLTARPTLSHPSSLSDAQDIARRWLFDSALPLWWRTGADHEGGGFYEKLGEGGKAIGEVERVRVQARQTYVYAQAGQLGWTGPWQSAMQHGLDFMLARYRREDGLFRSTLNTSDERIDLYDQAFVLFALAHAWRAEDKKPELMQTALQLLSQLQAQLKQGRGFLPGLPHDGVMRSNPLMHLLEATLAWVEVAGSSDAQAVTLFHKVATELCRLACDQLIEASSGEQRAIGECFNADWSAASTQIYEPGHQFEWAFLLLQAEALIGFESQGHAEALYGFGSKHGVDAQRGVTIFSVDREGRPTGRRARLWAQTERLRTSVLMDDEAAALDSFKALAGFLDVPTAGLWNEWQLENGTFESAPSPASSLYHLMTGLEPLLTQEASAATLKVET